MDLFGEEPTPAAEEAVKTQDFTASTIPDNQQELKNPRNMSFCLGHDAVEAKLIEMFQSGRMPHGLIFSGQKGIGKATMAYRLARFLLNDKTDPNQDALFGGKDSQTPQTLDVDPQNATFRRVSSGGHPDFMSIEREYDTAKNRYKSSVAVDAIRKVPGFLRMTASDGGWRVVIIDDADTMNRNAQNALLKILEEPPKKTVLILVTHRLGALIPTIRSRTQLINFQPLDKDTFEELIKHANFELSPHDTKALKTLSEGSIGKAMEIMEEEGLETLAQIHELLQYHPYWEWDKIHAIADNLARPGQDRAYATFTSLMTNIFERLCVAKARGRTNESLQGLMANSSLEQLLKICENLQRHFARVKSANLDKRQGIIGAFSVITAD